MPLSILYKPRWASLAFHFFMTFLFLTIEITVAQQVPHNSCASVFSYEREDDHWLGRVTPTQDGLEKVEWTLKFTHRGLNTPGRVSDLESYPDKETATRRLLDGKRPISVVRFKGYIDELPKVTHVELNGKVLCRADEYGAPSRAHTRQQTISIITNEHSPQVAATHDVPAQKPILRVEPRTWNIHITFGKYQEECGIVGPSGLAVGGTVIARGQFPWITGLYVDNDPDPQSYSLVYTCVATLISSRTLLSAAHCIHGVQASDVRIYVGRHDLQQYPESGAALLEIERIEAHPENNGSLVPEVDIALLILRTNVEFSNYVRPICMWESNTYLGPVSGENAQICGWGYDESGRLTRFPKMVNVHTMPQETCLRQISWAKDFITSRTICASNDMHHGPCLGDSGGSLMVQRNNKMYIRGVVSLGQRMGSSCDLKYPVIYCDVAQHRDWIERTMAK